MSRQFGPYVLIQQLAVGGMAEIHVAKTEGLAGFEKYVAIKMIHRNFSQDEQFVEMLIDEAKITVQLQHANIAQTFDLGRVGDTYYITMEYVDGPDLYRVLRKGSQAGMQVPCDVAAYVAKEIAMGLDYAHRRADISGKPMGIVHRDVSPQNILLSRSGEVKLIDFGIAKATMRARQTAVGVIKGKYYYMSPEQAWGQPVDRRSDIFSAGIVLYEMLTGQMLYLEEDMQKLLEMVRRAAIVSPRHMRPEVVPQLETIVMRALAANPDDRYQSAGDFALDLERFLHVYSPVFTANKVAEYVRLALGQDWVDKRIAPAPGRDPAQATMRLDHDNIAQGRSEFRDENSVIFRLPDATEVSRANASGDTLLEPDLPDLPAIGSERQGERGTTRESMIDRDSMEVTGELNAERTVVSEAPRGLDSVTRPQMVASDFDDGPTLMHAPMFDDGDGRPSGLEPVSHPSREHELAQVDPNIDDVPTLKPDEVDTLADWQSTDSGNQNTTSKHVRTEHPALVATTQRPVVSELRQHRKSRKTPVHGIAAQPSALEQILGPGGPGQSAMRRESGGPAQGLDPNRQPAHAGSGAAHGLVATTHQAMDHSRQRATGAGAGHVAPPFLPAEHWRSSQAVDLLSLEVDEIPEQFRIKRRAGKVVLLMFLAVLCSVAGMAGGWYLFRGTEPELVDLAIRSQPPEAVVKIDGEILATKTNLTARIGRGKTYVVEVELEGFRPYKQQVRIPESGSPPGILAVLHRLQLDVRASVTASVYFGEHKVGVTPFRSTCSDWPAPSSCRNPPRSVELRRKGYRSEVRPLRWNATFHHRLKVEMQPIKR